MPAKSSKPKPAPRGLNSLNPEQVEKGWGLKAGGATWAAIAEELGASVHVVRRVLSHCPPPRGTASPPLDTHGYHRWLAEQPPAAEAPSEPDGEAPELPSDLRPPATMSRDEQKSWYSRIISDCTEQHRVLQAGRATDEARKVLTLAISANKELARLNRDDGGDSIRINREELQQRAIAVRERLETYLSTKRPLLCAHCGHNLSVSWGRGEAP